MLKLENIIKTYKSPGQVINAVAGVDLEFRRSEFVSILGASGSGKTTMLNIVGGLDKYTSGDLIIEGTSTKKYKDADWDNYRNKRVGFVFQSYNLIPHLSLLGNVELALTISGISAKERKERAKEALESVGLAGHIKKRPNQLSGGQMQRVAIARAIVNRPEILLADEPTGALDTNTSEQIMELIKSIAKEKLVIMVTHNPELAEQYSSRIVRMSDGLVVEDTNPYNAQCSTHNAQCLSGVEDMCEANDIVGAATCRPQDEFLSTGVCNTDSELHLQNQSGSNLDNDSSIVATNTAASTPKKKKSSMSFWTAIKISSKNLLTKKRRSIMTAIASAIGILGIGLILALSTGMNTYIDELTRNQVETSPIQISTTTVTQANGAIVQSLDSFPQLETVFVDNTLQPRHRTQVPSYIMYMLQGEGNSFGFDGESAQLDSEWYNYILYRTGMDVNLFNRRLDGNYDMLTVGGGGGIMGMFMGGGAVQQMLCPEFTLRYYDLLTGTLPQNSNQIVLIVNEQNALTDVTLMGLGLVNFGDGRTEFSFEEILQMEFILPSNNALYSPVIENGEIVRFERTAIESPGRTTLLAQDVANSNYINTLTISGIIRLKEGEDMGLYSTGLAYPSSTASMLQAQNANSAIIEWMIANPNRDPFTGELFTTQQTMGFGGTTILTALNQWEDTFRALGGVPIDGITVNGLNLGANEIAIYATSLDGKDGINAVLEAYNYGRYEAYQIFFIDIIEMLGAMMSDMVGMLSIVLIAFTAISLVVSAVMISIITSISVLERTKEIGILRSIGARKKDVTRLFNAENIILGLFAGTIGVLITLLLSVPINLIIYSLAGVGGIASLTFWHAVILFLVSTGVAFISGALPARKAAKKDPVVALRNE